MKVVVLKENNRKYAKGFACVSEATHETALNWAKGCCRKNWWKEFDFPDVLDKVHVEALEDRMNNKVFKVSYFNPDVCPEIVYFDMYANAIKDAIMFGSISRGYIADVSFIEGGKLAIKDGKLYQAYKEKTELKTQKRISTKDYKPGYIYSTYGGTYYFYAGKHNKKHVMVPFDRKNMELIINPVYQTDNEYKFVAKNSVSVVKEEKIDADIRLFLRNEEEKINIRAEEMKANFIRRQDELRQTVQKRGGWHPYAFEETQLKRKYIDSWEYSYSKALLDAIIQLQRIYFENTEEK